MGLAEHSPDMPLKVLHGILVDPPIAVVGLSNWMLDPAKMNRAICLQRPEPSRQDIQLTGQFIIGSGCGASAFATPSSGAAENKEESGISSVDTSLSRWLPQLATAYHHVCLNTPLFDFKKSANYIMFD